jgi:hypothetical protein
VQKRFPQTYYPELPTVSIFPCHPRQSQEACKSFQACFLLFEYLQPTLSQMLMAWAAQPAILFRFEPLLS